MITIEHKEEYINGEKVKDYYSFFQTSFPLTEQHLFSLSLQDLRELYDKLGEIINKK